MTWTSTLPGQLRREADATEDLHPDDSQIEVMRNAADHIEELEREGQVLRQFCADLNNFHRHRFAEAVDKATDELFKECAWPRMKLREAKRVEP